MSSEVVGVPEAVRQKAMAHGFEGRRWLKGLGRMVEELGRHWEVTVGQVLSGGTESYVAAVRTEAGEHAVLKIEMPPYASFEGELRTLMAADGRGYARLLDWDEERRAMLQERLGPALSESGLSVTAQIEVLCTTLRSAWEVPAPPRLTTGAEKARWLAGFITATWEELGSPCSRRVVEQALTFAASRERAFDPETSVLVHGDAHNNNALRVLEGDHAPRQYKLADPDGLLAEPAYDLAIPMREWSGELLYGDALTLGRERCAKLSNLTGVDPRGIWEWGFIERVSTGLLATWVGADRIGKDMLEVAEAWARP